MTAQTTDRDDAAPADPELCRDALVASGQMAYRYDPVDDHLTLAGAVHALTGREATAIGSRLADLIALLHPDDQALIDALEQHVELDSFAPPLTIRCLHPDGTTTLCDVLGELFTPMVGMQARRLRCGVVRLASDALPSAEWRHRRLLRQLTQALDIGELGGWSIDIRAQQSTRTRRVDEIFGLRGAIEPWNYRVFLRHVHPDDRERVDRSFSRTLESGRDLDIEARIVRSAGDQRWIHVRGCLDAEPEADERVLICVIQDVTERKFIEQRDRLLADALEPLDQLTDRRVALEQVARLAVPFLGDHCSIDLYDEHAGYLRAASTSSLLASESNDESVAPAGSRSDTWQQLAAGEVVLLDGLEPRALAGIAGSHAAARSLRALEVSSYLGVPLKMRGRIIGILHFYRNARGPALSSAERDVAVALASRMAVALECVRLDRALRDSERRREEILAMMSHELRNPLASLNVGIDLIESETAVEEQRDWARHMMRAQIDRLASILASLLDVSRYAFDKIVLERSETELATLVSSAIDDVSAAFDGRVLELSFDAPGVPIHANIDAVKVSQAIGNLLVNAFEYGAGGGTIHVALVRERAPHGDLARLSVTDQGIGIASEHLERVFEPFAQIETTIDRSSSGLGMGLTLAQQIAGMHDGVVVVTSGGSGCGSTFTMTLPALPEQGVSVIAPTATMTAPLDASGRRLMLVDDNASTVDALRKLFQMKGFVVETAGDGPSAIALARTFRPQCAILDIGLPGLNGYEVARSLRTSFAGEPLLLVALSGYGQQKDRDRSAEAGFDHHLLKPVNFSTIMALLRSG